MHGLWLYKELDTDYGSVRLEIKKRNYTGEPLEIEALAADGIVLSMDGEEITDPIIGSQLTINIIDTGQIDTSLFFTPDSTLYSVALYYGGTLEWQGYLTPDSYIENLDYRDTIMLTARDNLGRLNDFVFKQTRGMVSVVDLIESLLSEVYCSQYVNWKCDKVSLAKGEGIAHTSSFADIWVNTDLFVAEEMTYREVVEEILRGLGCQMRFGGNNNLIVLNISDFSSIIGHSAIFVDRSGVKEIKPAWKELSVTQDYGRIENFYNGHITEQEIGWETFFVPSQKSNKWEGDMIFANQYGWPTGIEDDQDKSIFINAVKPYGNYSAFVVPVKATKTTLKLTMQLNNTLRWLKDNVFRKTSNLYYGGDGENHVISYNITHHIQIYLRNAAGETYIMSPGDWINTDNNILEPLGGWYQFKLDDCKYDDESTWNKDKECSIQINTIPFDGELLVVFKTATWGEENRDVANYMLYAKVKDITLAFDNNIGEKKANVQINSIHNVTEELELKLGQVPYGKGDYRAYAGGFYSSDGLPLIQWMRKSSDEYFYDLMELVSREHIHLNYDNYPLLSGTMMPAELSRALRLGENIYYEGDLYTIVSASLNVIKNAIDVSLMQKVVPYRVAELAVINSPLESGSGSKVGSDGNEVIQFTNDAGNAKRLYELDHASQDDMEGSYVLIDKPTMPEAKKVPFNEVGGLFKKAFKLHYNEDGVLVSVEVLANLWTNYGITAGGEGTGSGGGTGGATSLEGLNDVSLSALIDGQSLVWSSTLNKWINRAIESGLDEDALSAYLIANNYAVKGDIPSSLKSPYKLLFGNKSYDGSAEVTITAADLGALTEHQDISHLLSKEDAVATYQVKGNYLTGITSKMVTDALTYTPLANTTKYALSDSVGGNALNSAKLGGQLPSHYATATSVTKVADDLSTFKTLFDSMFEKKDGKIHAKLTLWTDYALVAGGEGDGTGGGGGGLTAFSVIINNKTYNSNNGTATITEQLQPLITTNNKLAYSLISGTPTSLPASDVYDWAKKSSLAASDVPDLSGSYLPLSGGTLTNALTIDSSIIYDHPSLKVINKHSSDVSTAFYWGGNYLYPNLIQGQHAVVAMIGIENSVKNAAHFGYRHYAKGSSKNAATIGMYGVDDLLNILASGKIGVKTLEPQYDFDVNGTFNAINGVISTTTDFGFTVNSSTNITGLQLKKGGTLKSNYGYYITEGYTFLSNETKRAEIRILDNGSLKFTTDYNTPATNLYDIIHTGNYADTTDKRYLQLSGGTIKDSVGIPLVLNTSSSTSVELRLQIQGSDRVQLGYNTTDGIFISAPAVGYKLGITTGGTPIFYNGANRTLYHTGNFNPANYLLKSGGTIDGSLYIGEEDNTAYKYLRMRRSSTVLELSNAGGVGVLNIDGVGFSFTSSTALWHGNTLIHSGNIGNQTVYMAYKAEKLIYSDGTIGLQVISGGVINPSNRIAFDANTTGICRGSYYTGALSDSDIVIAAPKMVFYEGNVLIGTTTDNGAKLQVNGISGDGLPLLSVNSSTNETWNYMASFLAPNTSVNNGTTISLGHSHAVKKSALLTYRMTGSSNYISIHHYGADNILNIYDNGNVGIGTTNPTSKLQVNGNISASGAITAGTASDRRLKDNICTINQNQAIKVLMALNPITYQWNDKARELGGYEGVSQGFIAQEYESIIPNSGRAIWGEYRAIDYTKAIPFVVSVAQNHEQRIRQLEEELNRLRREYYGIQ